MASIFNVGEDVWYAKLGDAEDGAGCFSAVVVSQEGDTVKLRITDADSSENGQEKTVSCVGEKDPDGYGAKKDPDFREEGYSDMVTHHWHTEGLICRHRWICATSTTRS